MVFFALVIFSLLLSVDAGLVANYPINAQLPPVARVSEPFEFTFSQRTFANSDSETEYSLSNGPSWLQVNSDNHTLIGTPHSGDGGDKTFKLVAKDESGSAEMEVSLIVTTDDGPKLGKPVLPQLENIGPTSAPSTIFVSPGDAFSISFAPKTFTNTRPSTVYYGTTRDNAPLPSWIGFDPSALKFSGHAPGSPSSGPQSFTFHLVASDVAGFSAATVSFDMVVSPHILAFDDSLQTLHVSRGEHFTSPKFVDSLTLDGKEPGSNKLTSVNMESPDWVSLDTDTISLSGTPPEDAVNENITVTVKDVYQDVTKLMVTLKYSQLFLDQVEGCKATIGEEFVFVFNETILTAESVNLEVDLGKQLSSWLHYNPDNKTLSGHVPADLRPQKFSISLTATQGSTKDTREFTVKVVEPGTSGDTGLSSGSGGRDGGIGGNKAGIIAISVVVPCVFLSTVLLVFCCWRHKRRAAVHEEGQLPQEKEQKEHRGGPGVSDLPNCEPSDDNTQDEVPDALERHSSSPQAPKLELGPLWNADSFDEKETGHETNKGNPASHSTIDWGFAPLRDPEPQETKQTEASSTQNKRRSQSSPRRRPSNYTRREPLKPIQPRRSMKRNSATSSKSRRNSKRSSGISSVAASGLPTRLSGAGHGAGGFGPPGYGVVRLSWQNPQARLSSDESSLESMTPLFPRPPPVRAGSLSRPEPSKRVSMRTVESQHSIISEADSFEEFMQSRARCRNSSNPMFSGQGNRRVSSGVRALERARSTMSPEGDGPSYTYAGSRTSMRERPVSTAPSSSIYSGENGPAAHGRAFSQDYSPSPNVALFSKRQSQSSVAQRYREVAAPLPRFLSESSVISGRRGEAGDESFYTEGYSDLTDERSSNGGQRRSSWMNGHSPSSIVGLYQPRLGRSLSSSSTPFNGKSRRMSFVRFAGKESTPASDANDQRGALDENEEGREVGERRSLPRDLTGSEMAFV